MTSHDNLNKGLQIINNISQRCGFIEYFNNLERTLPLFQVFLYLRCSDGDLLLPYDRHMLRGHYVI